MHLAIYTSASGLKSHIGLRKSDSSAIKSISLDSRMLFLNRGLFGNRLEAILSRFFGIKSLNKLSDLFICFPGKTDGEGATIIKSHTLNEISFPDDYNNFNFASALDKSMSKEKVHLVSSYIALGLGAFRYYKAKKPLLVLTIDKEGVHVSIVGKGSEIEIGDWSEDTLGNDKDNENKKSLYQLLSDKGIDEILFSSNSDVVTDYTLRLSEAVNHVISRAEEDGIPVSRVVVATERNEFIDADLLKDKCSINKILVPDSGELNKIFFAGCFSADEGKTTERAIKNIRYYAGGEHIHTFKSFAHFVTHFKEAKPIAYGENFYKVNYLDGSKRKVKIKELKYKEDLEQFRF